MLKRSSQDATAFNLQPKAKYIQIWHACTTSGCCKHLLQKPLTKTITPCFFLVVVFAPQLRQAAGLSRVFLVLFFSLTPSPSSLTMSSSPLVVTHDTDDQILGTTCTFLMIPGDSWWFLVVPCDSWCLGGEGWGQWIIHG